MWFRGFQKIRQCSFLLFQGWQKILCEMASPLTSNTQQHSAATLMIERARVLGRTPLLTPKQLANGSSPGSRLVVAIAVFHLWNLTDLHRTTAARPWGYTPLRGGPSTLAATAPQHSAVHAQTPRSVGFSAASTALLASEPRQSKNLSKWIPLRSL